MSSESFDPDRKPNNNLQLEGIPLSVSKSDISADSDNKGTDSKSMPLLKSKPTPAPGILTVTIHEAAGLSLPDQYQQLLEEHYLLDPSTKSPEHYKYRRLRNPRLYVLVEFDWAHQHLQCGLIGNPASSPTGNFCKFDVARTASLKLSLYVWNPNVPPKWLNFSQPIPRGLEDVYIGEVTVQPTFGDDVASVPMWVPLNIGIGKICIGLEYAKNVEPNLESQCIERVSPLGEESQEQIWKVKKADTERLYAAMTLQIDAYLPWSEGAYTFVSQINHPFVAPLQMAIQEAERLYIFFPFISGGLLFYWLQRERRFDVDRTRLYAAELLCAVEGLHDLALQSYELKPRNIHLDDRGHTVLVDFGLCGLNRKNTVDELETSEISDYPHIESIRGRDLSWWTLGCVIYEMLVGLPPFYDKDVREMEQKVQLKPLRLPTTLPSSAQDLISKLLCLDGEHSFGANGISRIKAHPFFEPIDWAELFKQAYQPIFRPGEVNIAYKERERRNSPSDRARLESMSTFFEGLTNKLQPASAEEALDDPTADWFHNTFKKTPILPRIEGNDDGTKLEEKQWSLLWDEAAQLFVFHDALTDTMKMIDVPKERFSSARLSSQQEVILARLSKPNSPLKSETHQPPSQVQMQDALESILLAGYKHMLPQLFKYRIDLNIQVFEHFQTPLDWAIDRSDVELVKLFLGHNADLNFTFRTVFADGPPLMKAVRMGSRELVELLAPKTERVVGTRALLLAVSRRDRSMVELLLRQGVRCDFEDADAPRPNHSQECTLFVVELSISDFFAPLVKAVLLNDKEIFQTLLSHGADPDVGYHYVKTRSKVPYRPVTPISFACGRVVQLCCELGQEEMVRRLVDAGAGIDLAQPVCQWHDCLMVARDMYLRVTAELRDAVAEREQSDAFQEASKVSP